MLLATLLLDENGLDPSGKVLTVCWLSIFLLTTNLYPILTIRHIHHLLFGVIILPSSLQLFFPVVGLIRHQHVTAATADRSSGDAYNCKEKPLAQVLTRPVLMSTPLDEPNTHF